MSYENSMSYVCRFYDLYELCKLFYKSIKNSLTSLEFVLSVTFCVFKKNLKFFANI